MQLTGSAQFFSRWGRGRGAESEADGNSQSFATRTVQTRGGRDSDPRDYAVPKSVPVYKTLRYSGRIVWVLFQRGISLGGAEHPSLQGQNHLSQDHSPTAPPAVTRRTQADVGKGLQDLPRLTCGVSALRGGRLPLEQQRRPGQSLEPPGREAAPHCTAGRWGGTCRDGPWSAQPCGRQGGPSQAKRVTTHLKPTPRRPPRAGAAAGPHSETAPRSAGLLSLRSACHTLSWLHTRLLPR